VITLEKAQEYLTNLQNARPTCANCETRPYLDYTSCPTAGWSQCESSACFVRRCPTCANTPKYPDARRVTAREMQLVVNGYDLNEDSLPVELSQFLKVILL
jgi:hypothetical protein